MISDLAKTYFEKKSGLAGASQRVRRPSAWSILIWPLGDTVKAAKDELASLSDPGNYKDDYEYMIAEANVYRERHDTAHALSGFRTREADWAARMMKQALAANTNMSCWRRRPRQIIRS